jgi:taurine dioxygenase
VLRRTFIDAGILVFRGLGGSAATQLNLSRVFGDYVPHPIKELSVDGQPELVELECHPAPIGGRPSSRVYEVTGEPCAAWQPWRADLFFMPEISSGGPLRAVAGAKVVPLRKG